MGKLTAYWLTQLLFKYGIKKNLICRGINNHNNNGWVSDKMYVLRQIRLSTCISAMSKLSSNRSASHDYACSYIL